jgi:hypothetical protein
MIEFHFAASSPIDIRRSDMIDLLMRVEGLEDSLTTISRENRIPPGEYSFTITVTADNVFKSKTATFFVDLGPELDAIEVSGDT